MPTPRIRRAARRLPAVVLVAILAALSLAPATRGPLVRAADRPVTIFMAPHRTLDPAAAADSFSSNRVAQFFEGLTALDSERVPQPALAERWELQDGGRTVVFTLRPSLEFSDGSPLTADDVVRSWLRVIDPQHPSTLAALLYDISGAAAYARGTGEKSAVGISASGNQVVVHLTRPATDFPARAASPTMAIVPPGVSGSNSPALEPGPRFVSSGGYVPVSASPTSLGLLANDHFWAGPPAIRNVTLTSSLGGTSPVDAFQAGSVDWTPVFGYDAPWIAYDRELGPQLRQSADLSILYYGFDTTQAPFSDVRVRKAFAKAVDWKRIVTLADGATALPATSMVPPGIPGRSDTDFAPTFDPAAAKQLLADAGFGDPATFPAITLVTSGGGYEAAVLAQLRQNLGIAVTYEAMDFNDFYNGKLGKSDGPTFWAASWIADYPSPNDFLGILLGTGQETNYGHWQNAGFDAAITKAIGASDEAAAQEAYDEAQAIVRDEVPAIPVSYDSKAYLSRAGLLGATANPLGILRIAGMAWGQ